MTGRPVAGFARFGGVNRLSVDLASARLASLPATARTMVGITGAPGAGKSTVAARLAAAVPGAVLVPMDGYHLAHSALQRLGTVQRKGAPDTFDAAGYVALLRRLRQQQGRPGGESVWAPEFRREIEDPVAGAIEVRPECPLVLTEGNYLLLDDGPWREVRSLLDLVWYVEVPEPLRHSRLTARHMLFGRDAEAAEGRTLGSDQANADLVAATRARADALIASD